MQSPCCGKEIKIGYSLKCQVVIGADIQGYGSSRTHCSRWRRHTSMAVVAEFVSWANGSLKLTAVTRSSEVTDSSRPVAARRGRVAIGQLKTRSGMLTLSCSMTVGAIL